MVVDSIASIMQEIKSFVLVVCIITTILFVVLPSKVSSGRECINQLTDLEISLLNNPGNIENLTKAFVPPNQPSPVVVRACYYVKPANHTPGNRECETDATYTFRWSTSPIFLYAPADLLKVLTFNLAEITEQTAILTIDAPVCDILLLNYLTTLLRAYMTARRTENGVDVSLVGSVAYYNATEDDFLLLTVGNTDLSQTPLLLTISGTPLVLCAALGVPIAIYLAYDISLLGKLPSNGKHFIVGFVIFLCIAVPIVIGIDIENVRSVSNLIQSQWIKYITLFGISAVSVYGLIAGFTIAYLQKEVWKISKNIYLSVTIQGFAIGLFVCFCGLLVFHGLFIVFFLLLTSSPQHITVSVVFYGACSFSFVVITTLFLVLLENRKKNYLSSNKDKWQKCLSCLTTSYLIIFFILVYFFLAAFIYCFSQFISYSTSDNSGSYIATLTPTLLLTVLGAVLTFILKNQGSLNNEEDTKKPIPGQVQAKNHSSQP